MNNVRLNDTLRTMPFTAISEHQCEKRLKRSFALDVTYNVDVVFTSWINNTNSNLMCSDMRRFYLNIKINPLIK